MPLWPFGRKKQRSSIIQPTSVNEKAVEAGASQAFPRNATPRAAPSLNNDGTPRKRRRSSEMPEHSERDPEKEMFDYEEPRVSRRRSSREDITALPGVRRLDPSPHLRQAAPVSRQTSSPAPVSRRAQIEADKSQPSNASTPQKRRLSRKPEHYDRALREKEIRAMSKPVSIPNRHGSNGDILRRDSKKARRAFSKGHTDSRGSIVSLPFQESIHSSMSGVSDQRGWEVSGLDFLNPRPTVRLSGSMPHSASFTTTGLSRDGSKREKLPAMKEGVKRKDRRRIAELADDLDAGDLRVLMDRDSKRKDKKRHADQEKLDRALRKRAEKQRAEEERRPRQVAIPIPPTDVHPAFRTKSEEKQVALDPTVGQGPPTPVSIKDEPVHLEPASKSGTYLRYGPQHDPFQDTEEHNPFTDYAEEQNNPVERSYSPMETPLESPVDTAHADTIAETPTEDPVLETAQAVRLSQGRLSIATNSPPRSPIHTAQTGQLSPLRREYTPDVPVIPPPIEERRTSDTAAKKPGTWASIFRRGGPTSRSVEAQRASTPDASFSNTSRESRARQPIPAHLVGPVGDVSRRRSGTPVRTQSVFREDLPEATASPPDSRVNSPDITLMAAQAAASRRARGSTSGLSQTRGATPDLTGPGRTDSPVEHEGRSSAIPMSTSLASFGSEGSWLTGRPSMRKSNTSQLRSSIGSLTKRREEFAGSYEDLGMPEDEYFRRINKPKPEPEQAADATGGAIESGDEDEQPDVVRRGTNRRRPTLVQRDPRIKSREGLLLDFQAGEVGQAAVVEEDASESEYTPDQDASPERDQFEQQVEYGHGHARQLSSGSAKLLDIPPSRNRSGRNSPNIDARISQAGIDTQGQVSPRL